MQIIDMAIFLFLGNPLFPMVKPCFRQIMWLCWKHFFRFWPTLLLWPSCQLWHYWNYDQQSFPSQRNPRSHLRLLQNPIPTSIIQLERPSQLLLSENVWMYTVWQNWRLIKDNISIIDHEYDLYLVPFAVTLRPRTNSLKLRKPLLSESRVWKIWKWLKLHLVFKHVNIPGDPIVRQDQQDLMERNWKQIWRQNFPWKDSFASTWLC